jgi:hypothetical protein
MKTLLVFMIVVTGVSINAQSRNQPSARDVAREIQRVDREQMLLRAPLRADKSDSVRMATLKKIKDDFRALQSINNKMMAEAFDEKNDIDYAHTAEMISQVRAKASSLKTSLSLPADENSKKIPSPPAVENLKDLRAALLILDKSVMSFVNNPMFQKADVVEVGLAQQASHDLETVISLSADLRKFSVRLGNNLKQNAK